MGPPSVGCSPTAAACTARTSSLRKIHHQSEGHVTGPAGRALFHLRVGRSAHRLLLLLLCLLLFGCDGLACRRRLGGSRR
jgi:hypothetical protein